MKNVGVLKERQIHRGLYVPGGGEGASTPAPRRWGQTPSGFYSSPNTKMIIGLREGQIKDRPQIRSRNVNRPTSRSLRYNNVKRSKHSKAIGGYISNNFNTVVTDIKLVMHFKERVSSLGRNALITVYYEQRRDFSDMDLSEKAEKIRNTPNAGGSSVESEVLSYELLHRCFGATLLKTETEIEYFPTGGSITDYTCKLNNNTLGVSVTRAWKYRGDFEQEDAIHLLTKKLKGILNATRNAIERWHKQILHIWTNSNDTAKLLRKEYKKLPNELVSNTVVLITVVKSPVTLFASQI